MTDLRTAAQQALKAMEKATNVMEVHLDHYFEAMNALRAALAEPVEEPVAYIHRQGNHWEVSERHLTDDEKARGWTEEPLYTAPPQRKPLTDEELDALAIDEDGLPNSHLEFARAIEQAHGIGGEK